MKEHDPIEQLSFLRPEEAQMMQMLRRFLAEASRIYETRAGTSLENPVTIIGPGDVFELLRVEMAELPQEQLRVLSLTTKNRVLSAPVVYQGTLNSTPVRVAELFRQAILDSAAAIILAHNHPSGDPRPSADDVRMTKTVVEAGNLLDIGVLDHVILTKDGFVSLREQGVVSFSENRGSKVHTP